MIKLRLSQLLAEENCKVVDLAKYLEVDDSFIYKWINEKFFPSTKNIIGIANFFNCSIEYLLGRTEDNSNIKFKQCPPFDIQFKKILEEKRVSQYKLDKEKIINRGNIDQWTRLKTLPRIEKLIVLADYLNITIDYLLGRE